MHDDLDDAGPDQVLARDRAARTEGDRWRAGGQRLGATLDLGVQRGHDVVGLRRGPAGVGDLVGVGPVALHIDVDRQRSARLSCD